MTSSINTNQPISVVLMEVYEWWKAREKEFTLSEKDYPDLFPDDDTRENWELLGDNLLTILFDMVPQNETDRKMKLIALREEIISSNGNNLYELEVDNMDFTAKCTYRVINQLLDKAV